MFPNLQEDLTHFFKVHYAATQEFTSSVYLQKKCFQDGKTKMGTIASVDTQSLTAVRDGKKRQSTFWDRYFLLCGDR